jgi:MFS family permease
VPLFGYRRKSWYVVMACLTLIFWALTALLAYAGVGVPIVYLATLNLAFATYAFVDVVCDALMVTEGRRLRRVGAFVNFQWTTFAVALALSVLLGGWLQQQVEKGAIEPWLIFLLTGIPPLVTAAVGLRNIEEPQVPPEERLRLRAGFRLPSGSDLVGRTRTWPARFRAFRHDNRPIWLLALFIFFWKFSPSIGYIERSYLIDEREFDALSFPLSFFLYLEPDHPWWDYVYLTVPEWLNPLPGWNRYQWFRLIVQTLLGFASIPAFIIPLTVAGETVKARVRRHGLRLPDRALQRHRHVRGRGRRRPLLAVHPAGAGRAGRGIRGLGRRRRRDQRRAHAGARAVRLRQPGLHPADDPVSRAPEARAGAPRHPGRAEHAPQVKVQTSGPDAVEGGDPPLVDLAHRLQHRDPVEIVAVIAGLARRPHQVLVIAVDHQRHAAAARFDAVERRQDLIVIDLAHALEHGVAIMPLAVVLRPVDGRLQRIDVVDDADRGAAAGFQPLAAASDERHGRHRQDVTHACHRRPSADLPRCRHRG